MNDQQLETELVALGRATEPPISLVDGVMRRIEQAAAPRMTPVTGRWTIFGGAYRAAAMLVVGACILAVIFWRHGNHAPPPPTLVVIPGTRHMNRDAPSFPTLADYQHAFVQSPEALESLLQQRPVEANAREHRVVRAGDVSLSDL